MRRPLPHRWLIATLAAVILTGCGGIPMLQEQAPSCTPPPLDSRLQHVDGIYVLPDNGRDPILDEIEHAVCTIDVATYLLSDDTVIDALIGAETRGVEVRVIYEASPFGGGSGTVEMTETLELGGVELRTGPADIRFMHAKYLVMDGQVGIVTNQNLTYSAFESNREIGVITSRRDDVAALAAIFQADWEGSPLPAPTGRLIVSPQNARTSLLQAIGGAEISIDLYAEVVRDDEIIDALSSAVQRGVSVRIVVNPADDDLDRTVYDVLSANGVRIRTAGALYIHAKAMVIDGERVVVGSTNPTATSLDENREVSLLVSDVVAARRVAAVFERDWLRSAPYGP